MIDFDSKFYCKGVMLKQDCFVTDCLHKGLAWCLSRNLSLYIVWFSVFLPATNCTLFFLQTRLADWKDGGLSSKFMFSRLKQASLELQQYEESAAPPGWKCVWDRWAWWKLNKVKQDHLPPLPHPNPPPQSYVRAHIHHSSYGRWYVTMVTMVTWHHVIIGCALLCEWGSVECEGKILFMCPKEIGLANKQRGERRMR